MSQKDTLALLNVRRLPARLTSEEAAPLLGLSAHDIPILVSKKLITPLGSPVGNAVKHFAAVQIEELAKDTDWLHDATRTLYAHWTKKNGKRGLKARTSFVDAAATS
jgi:hypothetical protein